MRDKERERKNERQKMKTWRVKERTKTSKEEVEVEVEKEKEKESKTERKRAKQRERVEREKDNEGTCSHAANSCLTASLTVSSIRGICDGQNGQNAVKNQNNGRRSTAIFPQFLPEKIRVQTRSLIIDSEILMIF